MKLSHHYAAYTALLTMKGWLLGYKIQRMTEEMTRSAGGLAAAGDAPRHAAAYERLKQGPYPLLCSFPDDAGALHDVLAAHEAQARSVAAVVIVLLPVGEAPVADLNGLTDHVTAARCSEAVRALGYDATVHNHCKWRSSFYRVGSIQTLDGSQVAGNPIV